METRDLPIYGNPDMSKLKSAKASLGLSYLTRPVIATASTNGRILAWGVEPPWLADYAYASDETSPDGLTAALRWVLGLNDDPRAVTILGTLTNIFGFGVRELDKVDVDVENRANALSRVSFRLKLEENGDSYDR